MENVQKIADRYSRRAIVINTLNYSFLVLSIGNIIFLVSHGSGGGMVVAIIFWLFFLGLLVQFVIRFRQHGEIIEGKIVKKDAYMNPGNVGSGPPSHDFYVEILRSENDKPRRMRIFEDLFDKLKLNEDYRLVASSQGELMTTTEDIIKPNNNLEAAAKRVLPVTFVTCLVFIVSFAIVLFRLFS